MVLGHFRVGGLTSSYSAELGFFFSSFGSLFWTPPGCCVSMSPLREWAFGNVPYGHVLRLFGVVPL